ncbi:MAG: cupin domain-containing protein [Pseudomonadota bacterium]
MHVKRFENAQPYEAPNHWGGSAGPDSPPFEKVYVVLDGEMTVVVDGKETTLRKFDSCTIAPGEVRQTEIRRNDVCTMLVVIPYPPSPRDRTY